MDEIIEQAYSKIEDGFPARLIADRFNIDYRVLFKLERKRKKKVNEDFSDFCEWLTENESNIFKQNFRNLINKIDYKKLSLIPQYWFISVYIFLKNKENKKNRIGDLYANFKISEVTWRKYKKEILKVV